MVLPETSPNDDSGWAGLPGFGKPLNYFPNKGSADFIDLLFPSLLSASRSTTAGSMQLPLTTLREFDMLRFMSAITDKPEWNFKINNPEIVKKWKDEGVTQRSMTQSMVDFCIKELQARAAAFDDPANPPPTFVFNGDVYKSDTALSSEFKERLKKAVENFEKAIPQSQKDWHPHSDEKVWDLVHPSLFPLVYGRTRILNGGNTTTVDDCISLCGEGTVVPEPDTHAISAVARRRRFHSGPMIDNPYSGKFQWLPCEVDISSEKAKITSYINNLHPVRETALFGLIEQVITAAIPLWQLSLAPLKVRYTHSQRIIYNGCEYDPDPGGLPTTEGPQQMPDEDEGDYQGRRQDWIEATRKVVLPEPPQYDSSIIAPPPPFNLREEYGERGLQVIVKLANIQLTPEKPKYNGGTWHVEGQLNEHIVATALYYYSCENITQSQLNFRQQVNGEDLDFSYEQDVHDWFPAVFGCENEGPGIQDVGGVATTEGRLLTFPNILQHQVGPFELQDPTKPGHRKILALFLVDPNLKIISTAHVPCQRKDWWWDAVLEKQHPDNKNDSKTLTVIPAGQAPGLAGLPRELKDQVLEAVDEFPYGMEEAKALRLELMEERKVYVAEYNEAFEQQTTFSLCEH